MDRVLYRAAPFAHTIVFGGLCSGTGKTWVDDLQLLVDGNGVKAVLGTNNPASGSPRKSGGWRTGFSSPRPGRLRRNRPSASECLIQSYEIGRDGSLTLCQQILGRVQIALRL